MNTPNLSLSFTFVTPPRIVVGWGAATDDRLAREAIHLGTRPLLVAGGSLRTSGALERIVENLRKAGATATVYDGVPPEPDLDTVERCRAATAGHDSVIAIGGGSVLDVAKCAAALSGAEGSVRDYFEGRRAVPEAGGLPILAVPTTAGTGSEVTWVGVYFDPVNRRKASIRGGAMLPAVALLDAELTVSCPASVTAHSGMDAFVQAVEAYTSRGATPLTDALAFDAALLASFGNVARAVANPKDRVVREAVALGSLMAGMALNTSRLGLVHGLAHPIGALTGAPHGLLCAMLLVPVMRFNRDAAADKYTALAYALTDKPFLLLGPPDMLIEGIAHCLRELRLPRRLSRIGLKAEDIERVAAESLSSGSTKANPRTVTLADARAVVESCF